MKSDLYRIEWKDIVRSIVTAILGFVGALFLGALVAVSAVFIPGFDISTADWNMILNLAASGSIVAGIGYLLKRFLSDDEGNTFGSEAL